MSGARRVAIVAALGAACGGDGTSVGAPADARPDAGSIDATAPATCEPASLADLHVPLPGGAVDTLGYPPYALDGCSLVYVGGDPRDLRVRDLATGAERTLAAASDAPRRPSAAGGTIAYEASEGGRRVVRVARGGVTVTVRGPFDHAGEPRTRGPRVVLTGWRGADERGDTDVFLYDVASGGPAVAVVERPGQQRLADIAGSVVAFADFSEDPTGVFDESAPNPNSLADVVLWDARTRVVTTRQRPGKQAFPQLDDQGHLAYLDWNGIHPEPKAQLFRLRLGAIDAPPERDVDVASEQGISNAAPYDRPALQGGFIVWAEQPLGGAAGLYRRPLDLSSPAARVFDGTAAGPIAGERLMAVSALERGWVLRVLAR